MSFLADIRPFYFVGIADDGLPVALVEWSDDAYTLIVGDTYFGPFPVRRALGLALRLVPLEDRHAAVDELARTLDGVPA